MSDAMGKGSAGSEKASRAAHGTLLGRLGLSGEPADMRFCWRLVGAFLLLYVLSFAVFYPNYATNHDEANYIRQAHLALRGTAAITQVDPLTGEDWIHYASTYAVATGLITAPFISVFGERGAFAVACLSLVLAVVVTARWLQSEQRSPAFSLLLLGFPPMLVMGRVAMSDVPSAAWVTLGFLTFWLGLDARGSAGLRWWLASGFIAGASLAFRASNPILFIPLFAGTVLRREVRSVGLVLGGVAGLGVRALTQAFFFGDALFERNAYLFSPETVNERLWLYLVALLVFVPGGLVLSLLYRGRRRPEVIATIVLFVTLYLFQSYSTVDTGLPKRLILGLRYLLPVLPIVAFAMAESVPRLLTGALRRAGAARRLPIERLATGALSAWLLAVGLGVVAVHPAFASWSRTQDQLRDAIETHIPNDGVLVTNSRATRKFLPELDRRYPLIRSYGVTPERLDVLVARHGVVYLALIDRTDSAFWRDETTGNAALLASLRLPRELLVEVRPTQTDHLRIWKLTPALPASETGTEQQGGAEMIQRDP